MILKPQYEYVYTKTFSNMEIKIEKLTDTEMD